MILIVRSSDNRIMACFDNEAAMSGHVFTGCSMVPVPEGYTGTEAFYDGETLSRDLEAFKAQRWSEIKTARDAAQNSVCVTPHGTMNTDPDSQRLLSGTVQMALIATAASQAFEIGWTMADNSVIVHSAAEIISAGVAVGQHIAVCHAAGQALRAALDAATTLEEIEAITWSLD